MKLRITEAVLAEAYRAKVCGERMEELAESIRKSVKERTRCKPLKQRKMKLRITEAVLAEAYRAKVCGERMEELAESIRKSVKERTRCRR